MSSTVICHNFASETTTLKLKVAAEPAPAVGFGNWGFLQPAGCYSHPLSDKSLELCTENLGSETGTDTVTITDCNSIFSSSPREAQTTSFWMGRRTLPRNPNRESRRKASDFPPPLTTMTGSSSLQVSRRTEPGGRLIIEAVETPFRNTYLQAERCDGRLRLSFITPEASDEDECGGETAEDGGCELEDEEGIEFDGEINLKLEIEKFRWLSGCKRGSHGNHDDLSCNSHPKLILTPSDFHLLHSYFAHFSFFLCLATLWARFHVST